MTSHIVAVILLVTLSLAGYISAASKPLMGLDINKDRSDAKKQKTSTENPEITESQPQGTNCSLENYNSSMLDDNSGDNENLTSRSRRDCPGDNGSSVLPSSDGYEGRNSTKQDQLFDDASVVVRNISVRPVVRYLNKFNICQCLVRRNHAHKKSQGRRDRRKKDGVLCLSGVNTQKGNTSHSKEVIEEEEEEQEGAIDCLPFLLFLFPSLCNETRLCTNLTETSLETLRQSQWICNKKKRDPAVERDSQDAVVYIVVVLAFYSFGIVFMMANFIRQEQRELEETKLYKQYVKVARDRWLTSRGNMANRLALQALNTFNAVPQTKDDNKITFV